MNLFVLSELHPKNKHVGWAVNYCFETILAGTCNATFIYPVANHGIELLDKFRHRAFKSWFSIEDLPTLGEGPNVLLIVGIVPRFLLSMHALGPLLKKFDLRVAYLLDGFSSSDLDRTVIPYLDYLFTIVAEVADEVNSNLSINSGFLPLATDALRLGSTKHQRFIDIINYGRSDAQLHQWLQSHYGQQDHDRLYFHSTFTEPDVQDLGERIVLLSRLLSQSKVSLCFESSHIARFEGNSPILLRWFEGWSAGCTIVGRKPFGKGVAELLDWENSTIELPYEASEWLPFFEELLNNNEYLLNNSRRNRYECLLRHDWRYRIKNMLQTLELPIPEQLNSAISELHLKAYEAEKVTN